MATPLTSFLLLGVTVGLLVVLGLIVLRTCRRSHRDRLEQPKHRMLEDD